MGKVTYLTRMFSCMNFVWFIPRLNRGIVNIAAAPAAYAHVVASRYRKLVDAMGGGSDTSSLLSGRDGGGAPRSVQALPALKLDSKYSMFFI
jgi:hypothetical protein